MVGQQLRDFVRERAKDQYEYCQLPHELEPFLPFHVDHIVAEQHGGDDDPMNLCWCCQHCNLKKGPNLSSRDGITGQTVELFNPRLDKWSEHFEWNGPLLVSNTPTGRATIRCLAINHPDNIAQRQAFIAEGVFPPQ
jgi:hypothetical protein